MSENVRSVCLNLGIRGSVTHDGEKPEWSDLIGSDFPVIEIESLSDDLTVSRKQSRSHRKPIGLITKRKGRESGTLGVDDL